MAESDRASSAPDDALRNELGARLDAIDKRFESIDKATDLAHADAVRVPTLIDRAIQGLKELHTAERATYIASVSGRIDVLQAVSNQRYDDINKAVTSAFAAQNEMQTSIAAGFTKSIDAMKGQIDTKTDNLASGLYEAKERLTAIENRTAGMTSATTEHRVASNDISTRVFSILAIIVAASVGLSQVILRLSAH
jgi:hypothetical protein